MRGVQYYYHSYTFFLAAFVSLLLFQLAFSITVSSLSSKDSLTISSNRTLVSPGAVFELGFFKPGTTSRWYIGIWYKTIPKGTYVWVANRDNPLSNSIGTLKISDTNLIILDQFNNPVWSTNLTRGDVRSSVVAELLDNGNFVLKYSNNNDPGGFLWQSFDFPTDTLLPQMKLGKDLKTGVNRFLTSWKSPDDPSTGKFWYKLETRGLPEFFLWNSGVRMYRSGPWDGTRFNGMPEMRELEYMAYNFTENKEEVVYTFLMNNHSIYSRLTMSPLGNLQQFTWSPAEQDKDLFWFSPKDQCDGYEMCGNYSYCDLITSPVCNCIRGFKSMNMPKLASTDGSGGCVRKTPLSCGGDKFLRLRTVKLPDTTGAIVDRRIGVKECEERCLKDCNCTAFANTDIRFGGSGCVIWTGELLDIRNYAAAGQDLYVRVAASDFGDGVKKNISRKIVSLIVGVSIILLLSFIIFCFWKRKQKREILIATPIVETAYKDRNQDLLMNGVVISSRIQLSEENETEHLELPLMEFETVVMATDNFSDSNKLGQGGFGIVYKGRLIDGQEIAVKRLSKMSLQGTNEFRNEVRLIARLQHINLVRLLGCYVDVQEKMLIYEFMENGSLDSYIFDKTKSAKLNWQKRFDITNGIARGLLYLHQDSRFRIIHRDLKASNILLDKDMTPKISDFGMARIFARDEMEAKTVNVVGTYGYMSPEYAMYGIFSVKSDVFSFGVFVLEIVSGKRNRGSDYENNLLSHAWMKWKEGNALDIVDPIITDSPLLSTSESRPQEVLRCIQIGLLCVQDRKEDRPVMSSVVSMLGNETAVIPQPNPPGFCFGRSYFETDSSSSSKQPNEELFTMNQITVSVIDAR